MFFNKNKAKKKALQVSNAEKKALLQRVDCLQEELALAAAERDDLLKQISCFEIEYNQRLGKYLQRILVLRMELAKLDANIDPEKQNRYQETVEDYENFNNKSHDLEEKKLFSLSDEKLAELKTTFRRAARLCHPDVVAEENKAESQKTFIALRQAYERNDVEVVNKIADHLAKEKTINNKNMRNQENDSLIQVISSLENKIESVNNEMIEIMSSETFQIISTVDKDTYFENLKDQLEIRISELEKSLADVKS